MLMFTGFISCLLHTLADQSCSCRTMFSLDEILNLSRVFGLQANEASALLVLFVFSIVWQLVDAALDDEGLLQLTEIEPRWPVRPQDMEVDDVQDMFEGKRKEYNERLRAVNTVFAIELLGEFLQNKVTLRILHLASQNMLELKSLFSQVLSSDFDMCCLLVFLLCVLHISACNLTLHKHT